MNDCRLWRAEFETAAGRIGATVHLESWIGEDVAKQLLAQSLSEHGGNMSGLWSHQCLGHDHG